MTIKTCTAIHLAIVPCIQHNAVQASQVMPHVHVIKHITRPAGRRIAATTRWLQCCPYAVQRRMYSHTLINTLVQMVVELDLVRLDCVGNMTGQISSFSMASLRLWIWLFSWLPSLVVTDAAITGRDTPQARPRAALEGT
eukprot:GHRQ01037523.1.p1 GENE.GHRQ01037523.1~~GHRQ01037523.1.p1  ORF type:complete len:140 (+),score=4.73 GHRQ01037523.1:280-699(+)